MALKCTWSTKVQDLHSGGNVLEFRHQFDMGTMEDSEPETPWDATIQPKIFATMFFAESWKNGIFVDIKICVFRAMSYRI